MKFFLIIFSLFSFPVFAVPISNVLIGVDSVKIVGKDKIKVTYTIPCVVDDWSNIVMSSDDTGDMTVAVGLVYSETDRNGCESGIKNTFFKIIETKTYGYSTADEVVVFESMEVKK